MESLKPSGSDPQFLLSSSGTCFDMYTPHNGQLSHTETTCGSLLSELQKIWDEVGEPGFERDKMLVELEKECLEAYRRKVDHASQCRAQLRKAVADFEAELACISSALGERPVRISQPGQCVGNLKKALEAIKPQLEEMRKRKKERKIQFVEVLDKIQTISKEIHRYKDDDVFTVVVDESDLSLKRLEELHSQLVALKKEKSDRLKQVLDHLKTLDSLCVVLGMDFKLTVSQIHPTLDGTKGTTNISSETIEKLSTAIHSLREVKIQRMQRLQDLATTMVELWSLMDTPLLEQQMCQNVTKTIAASEEEITEPNTLSVDFLTYAEAEVSRLEQMKSSKMKEVLLRKRSDLEEICRKAHMVAEALGAMDSSLEAIENSCPSYLLEQIELQISNVKAEAFSRKDILDKVEKWLAACEEESWLEEYNRDDNRYNAGRGTHLMLKRAEKARALANKIPVMVEALTSKAMGWENERGAEFSYDGIRLLSMLEQYSILKQEKEQELQRQRDQKKLEGQLIKEREALFGSKPSPSKSGKKSFISSNRGASSKRFSLGVAMLQTPNPEKTSARPSRLLKKSNPVKKDIPQNHNRSGGFTAPSSGRRNLDCTDLSINQQSSALKTLEFESPVLRKPLSPVSSALSSQINIAANTQDQSRIQNWQTQKPHPSGGTPVGTPSKIITDVDDKKTPRTMPIPMSTTPSTGLSSMKRAPATPCIPYGLDGVEYSFEERRAGFIVGKTN